MPSRYDYVALAKELKKELDDGHLAFKSYERRALTERLRKIAGEPNTRIKSAGIAKDIEGIFAEQGMRFYPRLTETSTGDWVRVWRAGTLVAEILDHILNPSERSDTELGEMASKIKGKWIW